MANEKRLIPLQKRIVYAGDVLNSLMSEKSWSVTEAADFIKAFRTVDAVEVVRCKDCKNYFYSSVSMGMRCRLDGTEWGKDDFCSCGERKDNG